MPRRPTLASRAHRLLLKAYPRRYRERFGEEMSAHFFAELAEVRARGGLAPALLWIRTVWDVLRIAGGAHLQRFTRPEARDPGAGIRQRRRRRIRNRSRPRPWQGGRGPPGADLATDLRFAVRGLRRDPTFAVAAISTLALGIGATATALAVMDAVLIRPLPYQHPERLVTMTRVHPRTGVTWSQAQPPGILHDLMERSRSFSGFATVQSLFDREQNLSGAGEPARIDVDWVSPDFFDVLGVEARVGRTFEPDDARLGAPRVAVLSHATWNAAFGGDPAAIGGRIVLNETPHTIIGVMPREFRFVGSSGGDVAVWLPESVPAEARDDRYSYTHRVVARLRDDVPLSQAQGELDATVAELAEVYPEDYRTPSGDPWTVRLSTLHDQITGPYRLPLFLMAGAVGLLLLITWINVGNLLLSRTSARDGELAVRAAIGAGRWRVTKLLLTEALVLSLSGGVLGLVLTRWLITLLPLAASGALGEATGSGVIVPLLARAEVTGWVAWTTALTCLVTAAACALGPVVQFVRNTPLAGLASGGRSRPRRSLGRRILTASEVSLTTALLIGVALLASTMVEISRLPLGFEPGGALVMRAELAPERYADLHDGTARDRAAWWTLTPEHRSLVHGVVGRLERLPGVDAVGATTVLPFQAGRRHVAGIHFPGLERDVWQMLAGVEMHGAPAVATVTPGYFKALGLPLVTGRGFTAEDRRSSPGVVVVNQKFVEDFALEAPLGQPLLLRDGMEWRAVEVVGVVGNTRTYGYPRRIRPNAPQVPPEDQEIYVPLGQAPHAFEAARIGPQMSLSVVVRHRADPDEVARAMRSAVAEVDPDTPVTFVAGMDRYVSESLSGRRFQLLLMGALAGASLLLALIGTYGVVAFDVSRRVREMGIRLALGARGIDVTGMIVREGVLFTAAGVLAGVVAAMAATRLLAPWLYGVSPTEPAVFAGLALLMAVAAMLACWIPARRAARADPIDSLRAE